MRIPRLYIDQDLSPDSECELPTSRAHYLSNVLRLQPGRLLIVFNGQGGEYRAELVSANRKTAVIQLSDFVEGDKESHLDCELAIAVSKGDRMDWIVQKATELGVKKITPLLSERNELKLNKERWQKKINHWGEIIISACEQSGRNILPKLDEQKSLPAFLDRCEAECKLVLHTAESTTSIDKISKPQQVSLLIGPEGGLSDAEVDLAKQKNFLPCLFGPRVLRTETAPVTALSIVQYLWGDLGN